MKFRSIQLARGLAGISLLAVSAFSYALTIGNQPVRHSDAEFTEFIQNKVYQSPSYQLLPNRMRLAAVKVEIEDTYDDLSIQGGVKHRAAGYQDGDTNDVSGYVTATLPLLDWGRVGHRVEGARLEKTAQQYTNEMTMIDISDDVIGLYFSYLQQQHKVALYIDQQEALEVYALDLEKRYLSGAGSRLDLDYISAELKVIELELLIAAYEQEQIKEQFERLYGGLPNENLLPAISTYNKPVSRDMLDKIPSVQAADLQTQASRQLMESKKAERWPGLDLKVSILEDNLEYETLTSLELTYNIYQGGRKQLNVYEQDLQVADSLYQLKIARKEAHNELRRIQTEWQTAQQQSLAYAELAKAKRAAAADSKTRLLYSGGRLRDVYEYERSALQYELQSFAAVMQSLAAGFRFKLLINERSQ